MTMSDVTESAFGRLINISARQRMLSQRIGFLFLTIDTALKKSTEPPADLLGMLKTATVDFVDGYRILQQGKPEEGLPHLNSARVRAILDGAAETGGRVVIERFLAEVADGVERLSRGEQCDEDHAAWLSKFILTDLLAVLQSIVAAIESDFGDEMNRRSQRRNEEVAKVMQALTEIQKASKFSRMIALNAKISADRAGPHGREFGALTDQIKQISNDITASSQQILQHLDYV